MAEPPTQDTGDLEDLPALATAEQLSAYSQEDVGSGVDLLLGGASAIVRAFCGWRIAPAGAETAQVLWRGGPLLLPTLRLSSVQALSIDGVALDVTGWRPTRSGIVLPPTAPQLWPGVSEGQSDVRGEGRGERVVEVMFTHGYPETPPDVRAVVCALATRALINPASLTQESIGGYSATYAPGSSVGVLPTERAILARHRLPGRV